MKSITVTHPERGTVVLTPGLSEENTFHVGFTGYRIGVIIPTRGDRIDFIKHAIDLISTQTITPCEVVVIDDPPTSNEKDITKRYRLGYDELRNKGLDVIFMWEDDDFYCTTYIETMLNAWINHGKPELFGTSYTIYYHIGLRAYFTMHHLQRSSAMSTMIKPDINFDWCADSEPYTDTHLWMVATHKLTRSQLTSAVFTPSKHICLGIKHGIGLTGGNMHTSRLHRYRQHGQTDRDLKFLSSVVDKKSLEFYSGFYNPDFNPH